MPVSDAVSGTTQAGASETGGRGAAGAVEARLELDMAALMSARSRTQKLHVVDDVTSAATNSKCPRFDDESYAADTAVIFHGPRSCR